MLSRTVTLCALLAATSSQAADVVLIRKIQTAPSRWDTQSAIDGFVGNVRQAIQALGIAVDTLDDPKANLENLRRYRLVILPHNPGLPDGMVAALEAYVAQGGHLGLFYNSTARLVRLIGIEGTAWLGGDQLPAISGVRFDAAKLAGAPALLAQRSPNFVQPTPGPQAVVAGTWLDGDGQDTGRPALTIHESGFLFGHVMLGQDGPGDRRLMLAVLGRYLPDVWPAAVAKRLAAVGQVGGHADLAALTVAVERSDQAPAKEALRAARTTLAEALAKQQAGDLPTACDLAEAAGVSARQAFVLSRSSRPRELRGAWIHNAYGIVGWDWDQTVKALADAGFNAIFPNLCWGAVADYPSEVLPVHPDVATKGDQIALCLAACRKYGVECHIWKVNWNMGHHTPEAIRDQMREAGRTQVLYDGTPSSFLAPHRDDNFQLERDAMLEIVRKYDVDGIHFDYIRYPSSEGDFSPAARAAFEAWLGQPVADWPAGCRRGALSAKWNEWRRGNITRLVAAVSEGAHRLKPQIQVSAAVFGDWDASPNSIAQATVEWIDRGYLDFVCPMNYTNSDAYLRRLLVEQTAAVRGRIPLYSGLGSWRHEDAAATAAQIDLTRELGADGFVCFEHNRGFAVRSLPSLATGPTRLPAGGTPHRGLLVTSTATGAVADLDPPAFAVGRPIEVKVAPQAGAELPAELAWQATCHGAAQPAKGAARRGADGTLMVSFTPSEAGVWRLELASPGEAAPLARTVPVTVLSEAEVQERLTRNGPPRFKGDGGLKVAIWHDAYGAVPLLEALVKAEGLDAAPLYNFRPASLAACQVVVLPQPRRGVDLFYRADTIKTVQDYLAAGGGVLVTHALVGIRSYLPYGPAVATGGEALGGRDWQAVDHPVTAGLGAQDQRSTFGDRISVVPGPQGTVVATTAQGEPVMAVGPVGRGRYAACGLGVAIGSEDADVAPSEAEWQLVLNTIRWLGAKR